MERMPYPCAHAFSPSMILRSREIMGNYVEPKHHDIVPLASFFLAGPPLDLKHAMN